jgi:hypothetical protein
MASISDKGFLLSWMGIKFQIFYQLPPLAQF